MKGLYVVYVMMKWTGTSGMKFIHCSCFLLYMLQLAELTFCSWSSNVDCKCSFQCLL